MLLKALFLVRRNTVYMLGGIFRSKVKDSVLTAEVISGQVLITSHRLPRRGLKLGPLR